MYDTQRDVAFWVTPAQSWQLLNVYPFLERIDPVDANYEAVRQLAGPAPVIYLEPTEDYGGAQNAD